MKNCIILIFVFITCTIFINESRASHFKGGEITWTCLGNGQYQFQMKYYRDCNEVPGPAALTLTTNVPGVSAIPMNLVLQQDISMNGFASNGTTPCPTCANGPNPSPGIVEELVFESLPVTLTGTPPANGWIFSWSECCRNDDVTNISNAGTIGMGLRAIMYPYNGLPAGTCFDSSPYFVESPTSAFCNGVEVSYNQIVVDPDRDSLVYSWTSPLTDVFTTINFASGYAVNSQLPGPTQDPANSGVTLDPATGHISFTSFTGGRFTTSMKVTSYRNGFKMAEIFRDMDIELLNNCLPIISSINIPPIVNAPFYNVVTGLQTEYIDTVYAGDTVNFQLTYTDFQFFTSTVGQEITVTAAGDIFGTNFTDPNQGCATPPCATLSPYPINFPIAGAFNFNWVTSCDHLYSPDGTSYNNRYTFTFSGRDNYCPANGLVTSTITIVVLPRNSLQAPVLRCASVNTNGSVSLSWTKSPSIDSLGLFQSYKIYASLSAGGPFQLVDSVTSGINATSYTHSAASQFNLFGVNANQQSIFYQVQTSSYCSIYGSSTTSNKVQTIKSSVSSGIIHPTIINWNAPSNPLLSSQNPVYKIFKEYPIGVWSLIDSTTALTYSDFSNLSICNDSVSYKIEMTDSSGCVMTSSVSGTIVNNPILMSQILPIIPILCGGGSVTLSALAGYTYDWSNGTTTQTINVSSPGAYTVTVTNSGGCSATGTTVVNGAANPTPVITGTTTICMGNTTIFDAGAGYVSFIWSTGAATPSITVSSSGIYSVTVTDANGCTGTDSETLTVNPLPVSSVTSNGPPSFCQGDSLLISIPGSFNTYQWYIYGNPINPSQTSSSIHVKSPGFYRCMVTDANGCSNFSSGLFVSMPCVVLPDPIQKLTANQPNFEFEVYPNPSSGIFNIEMTEEYKKPFHVSVTDLLGKSLIEETSKNYQFVINLSTFQKGIYLLKINDGSKSAVMKLVKYD